MISPPLSRSDGSSQSNMWIVVAGKERERRARDCRARGRTRDGARVRRLRLGRTGCVVRRGWGRQGVAQRTAGPGPASANGRSRDLDSVLLRCYERDAVSTPCVPESLAQT